MKRITIGALIALAALALLFPTAALAALRVEPAFIDQQVAVGENSLQSIAVRNTGDSPLEMKVAIKGYGQSMSGMTQPLDNDNSLFTIADHVVATPNEFSLQPGETGYVDVTVDIPEGSIGGKYATVYIYSIPPAEEIMGISEAVVVGLRLVVTPSRLSRSGRIDSTIPTEVLSGNPIPVVMTFTNTGNVHYRITGKITIKDDQGNVLFTSDPAASYNILPSYSQRLEFTWTPNTELPPAVFTIEAEATPQDGGEPVTFVDTFELTETYYAAPETSHVGAIVGGSLGGVIVVAGAVSYFVLRRRPSPFAAE